MPTTLLCLELLFNKDLNLTANAAAAAEKRRRTGPAVRIFIQAQTFEGRAVSHASKKPLKGRINTGLCLIVSLKIWNPFSYSISRAVLIK